jgi:tetratricopeptide (TPR) repeat protein
VSQSDHSSQQARIQNAVETGGKIPDDLARTMTPEQVAQMQKDIRDRSEGLKKRTELNDSFNAGMTAKEARQWDQAVASFTKASELDPTQYAVWANLGESYGKLAETKTGREFDATIQKALDAYSKAIELKPDDAASHNNYAIALGKARKFSEMEAELKKAVDLDPSNGGKYYYNLGAMLVNSGQGDAAGEAFKKAIELTPNYADAYYQYGVTLIGKAQVGADGKVIPVPGTVEAFQIYLGLQPDGPYAKSARDMLTTLGSTVDTKFQSPASKNKKK